MKRLQMLLMGAVALAVFAVAKPAFAVAFLCTPDEVAVVDVGTNNAANRVHVHCTTSVSDGTNVFYFAVPSYNAAYANRLMSLATTAISTGRPLLIQFNAGQNKDPQGVDFGCLATDCRNPWFFSLH